MSADFSRLDPGGPDNQAVPGQWVGDGQYRVVCPLSGVIARTDSSGIRIPLRATAVTGSTIDRRVQVCLSNRPPLHVSTRVVDLKDAPYRSGDSLVLETTWRSPDNLSLRCEASFSEVDTSGFVGHGVERGEGVFLIRYRMPLSADQMPPDGTGKAIPVTVRDSGCGVTELIAVRIDTDTEPPAGDRIRIDPLPSATTAESLLITGEIPQAVVVRIIRNKLPHADAVADPVTGRFSGMLELLPGENRIQVRGEDAAGNSTLPFPRPEPVVVYRIGAVQLDVAGPYSRKDDTDESARDDIVLLNPEPMDGLVIRIFNLEGDCLWEERPAASDRLLKYRFHWTGTNRGGDRAPQGYYLVRAEWRRTTGEPRSITKGLLLRD